MERFCNINIYRKYDSIDVICTAFQRSSQNGSKFIVWNENIKDKIIHKI